MRRALTIAFAVAAIAIGSSTSASAVTTVGVSRQSASAQNDLVALVNAYRASNGLQAVSPNGALTAAAGWMAGDMASQPSIGKFLHDVADPRREI